MAKKFEYVKNNINVVQKLIKSGDVSCKILADYQIYQVWMGYSNISSKMERYQLVADTVKASTQNVMRAIKSMESSM